MSFPLVLIGPADQLSLYIYAFTPEDSLMMFILSVYVNLCLIGPVHIDMEEAHMFVDSVSGLALEGERKANFSMLQVHILCCACLPR